MVWVGFQFYRSSPVTFLEVHQDSHFYIENINQVMFPMIQTCNDEEWYSSSTKHEFMSRDILLVGFPYMMCTY